LRGDVEEAARRYQDVLQEFPGDPVASTHVERLAAATRIDPARPRGTLVRS